MFRRVFFRRGYFLEEKCFYLIYNFISFNIKLFKGGGELLIYKIFISCFNLKGL